MTAHLRPAMLAAAAGLLLAIACTPAQAPTRDDAPVLPPEMVPRSRQVVRPAVFPDTGLPYSPGILFGNTLYLSGQLGRDPATAQLVAGGIEAETRQALANLRQVLRAAGMDFEDVVSVTTFLADFRDFPRYNEVYREFFPEDPPARATVQVAALNLGARIEIQMIAASGRPHATGAVP